MNTRILFIFLLVYLGTNRCFASNSYFFFSSVNIQEQSCDLPPDNQGYPMPSMHPFLPTFQEYLNIGGFADSECGLDENSFMLEYQNAFFDPTMGITIDMQEYSIMDSCGNKAYCMIQYETSYSVTAPPALFYVEGCGMPDEIEALTGLAYYEGSTFTLDNEIPQDKFIEIGGQLSWTCNITQGMHIYHQDYISRSYSSVDCHFDLQRWFFFFDYSFNYLFSSTQFVQIYDYESPTIIPINDLSYSCKQEATDKLLSYSEFIQAGGEVYDNCSIDSSSFTLISETKEGNCPSIIKRQYRVKDQCGNKTEWEQIITILDTIPPVFVSQPQPIEDIVYGDPLPGQEDLLYDDNCGIKSYSKSILPYTEDTINGYAITYLWEVTDSCGNSASTTASFNVLPPPLKYCESSGNASNEWIKSVTLDSETSDSGTGGYEDFTSQFSFNLQASSTYNISLVPGFSSKSQFECWAIWIDFDLDGIFSESEKVFSANRKKSTVTGTLTIPNVLPATTRMRVSMKNSAQPSACEIFGKGEVEDYAVTISNLASKSAIINNTDLDSQEVSIFPNPAKTVFNVVWKTDTNDIWLQLFDAKGILLFEKKHASAVEKIDISNLQPGMYFLVAKNRNSSYRKKVIKL